MPQQGRQHVTETQSDSPAGITDTYLCVYKMSSCKEMLLHWFYHRSGSTHTILFCSSQMTVRRRVSREAWSHQESGSMLWYRHGNLSNSGSSFWEQASSCSSDWPWRWSLDLEVYQWPHEFTKKHANILPLTFANQNILKYHIYSTIAVDSY